MSKLFLKWHKSPYLKNSNVFKKSEISPKLIKLDKVISMIYKLNDTFFWDKFRIQFRTDIFKIYYT